MADDANRNANVRHLVPKKRNKKTRNAARAQSPEVVALARSPASDVLKVRAHAIPKHRLMVRSLAGRLAKPAGYLGACAAVTAAIFWLWPGFDNGAAVLAPDFAMPVAVKPVAVEPVAEPVQPLAGSVPDTKVPLVVPEYGKSKSQVNANGIHTAGELNRPEYESRQALYVNKPEPGVSAESEILKIPSREVPKIISKSDARNRQVQSKRIASEDVLQSMPPSIPSDILFDKSKNPSSTIINTSQNPKVVSNQLIEFEPAKKASGTVPATFDVIKNKSSEASQDDIRVRVLSVPVDGMVTVDHKGTVRMYRVGQTLPDGQKVLSADSTSGHFILAPP